MNSIKIGILDDHQIIIDGLKLLLSNEPNLSVVSEFTSGKSLISYLEKNPMAIDILLMDLMMPEMDGYEVAKYMSDHFPSVRIIVLTMNTQPDYAHKLIEKTDTKAYLPKTINKKYLIETIHKVQDGNIYIHPSIKKELELYEHRIIEREKFLLSARELEVIDLICQGYSNKAIAGKLYLSEHTIATHRKNISRKTNTHNAASLVELTKRMQLLD